MTQSTLEFEVSKIKKKIFVSIIVVLLILIILYSTNNTTTIKDGTYILSETEANNIMAPRVHISQEDIYFSYDLLSSYLVVGAYTIEKDILTMRTRDNQYKYVFQIKDDQLIFKADESSEVKLIDNRLGVKITNDSAFKLVE